MSQCRDDDIQTLLAQIDADAAAGSRLLDTLLGRHADDARLHFLKGSLLASRRDYGDAQAAMRRAVALAPGYHIARFQLGFLLLTSGEPVAAQEAWGPLHGLAPDDALRLFAEGLTHLIGDRFDATIETLRDGIAHNRDFPALSDDMRLIIAEAQVRIGATDPVAEPISSTQALLQQAAYKATKH